MVPSNSPHLPLPIIIAPITYSIGKHFLAFKIFHQLFHMSIRQRCKNTERVSIQTAWCIVSLSSFFLFQLFETKADFVQAEKGQGLYKLTLACASTPWRGYGTKKDSVNLPCRSKV